MPDREADALRRPADTLVRVKSALEKDLHAYGVCYFKFTLDDVEHLPVSRVMIKPEKTDA